MQLVENMLAASRPKYFYYDPKTGAAKLVGRIKPYIDTKNFWKLKIHIEHYDPDGDTWEWELTYYHPAKAPLEDLRAISTTIISEFLQEYTGSVAGPGDLDKWNARVEVHPVEGIELQRLKKTGIEFFDSFRLNPGDDYVIAFQDTNRPPIVA